MRTKIPTLFLLTFALLLSSCGGTNTGNAGSSLAESGRLSETGELAMRSTLSPTSTFYTEWCFSTIALVIETQRGTNTYGPFPFLGEIKEISESGTTELGSFPMPQNGKRLIGVKIQLRGDCGGSSPSVFVQNQYGQFEIRNAINLEYTENINLETVQVGQKIQIDVDITNVLARLREIKSSEEIQNAMYGRLFDNSPVEGVLF